MNNSIAHQALEILKNIPPVEWGTGSYEREEKCCGLGLIRKSLGVDNQPRLSKTERPYLEKKIRLSTWLYSGVFMFSFTDVNDGNCEHYKQSTPKKRVVALLKDMINSGF